jgi:UTP--glucose-1-phosphate uridylyltransferase
MRYVPVKTTADLLLIQSDIFSVKHGALILNGDRSVLTPPAPRPGHSHSPPLLGSSLSPALRMDTPLPIVKLGKEFSAIDDYQKRVPKKHPNILELEHLTIAGDVYIGSNVTLTGTVIIIAVDGSVIMIPDGSVLVDKVVTGNLRILDH